MVFDGRKKLHSLRCRIHECMWCVFSRPYSRYIIIHLRTERQYQHKTMQNFILTEIRTHSHTCIHNKSVWDVFFTQLRSNNEPFQLIFQHFGSEFDLVRTSIQPKTLFESIFNRISLIITSSRFWYKLALNTHSLLRN